MTTFVQEVAECNDGLHKPPRILRESGPFCYESNAGERNRRFEVQKLRRQALRAAKILPIPAQRHPVA